MGLKIEATKEEIAEWVTEEDIVEMLVDNELMDAIAMGDYDHEWW